MVPFGGVVFLLLASPDGFVKEWSTYDMKAASFPDSLWDGGVKSPKLYNGIFAAIAFFAGAITSLLAGYLGMMIATYANARTALEAQKGIAPAFVVAFRSGAVMGFLLTSLGLIVLFVVISVFRVVRLLLYQTQVASLLYVFHLCLRVLKVTRDLCSIKL
jgi:inorganic pyrophosphatase